MTTRFDSKDSAGWVELPTGIFTADGVWFHTMEADLRAFAGEVIDRVGVGSLVMDAGSWLRSADAAGAIALATLLLVAPPLVAALGALLVYVAWEAFAPAMVFVTLVKLFKLLSRAGVQGFLYIVILSWLGMNGEITAVVFGLIGFILLRWGLVRKGVSAIFTRPEEDSTQIPRQDRILRALILRHAVSMMISIPATDAYEKRILEIWQRGKRRG